MPIRSSHSVLLSHRSAINFKPGQNSPNRADIENENWGRAEAQPIALDLLIELFNVINNCISVFYRLAYVGHQHKTAWGAALQLSHAIWAKSGTLLLALRWFILGCSSVLSSSGEEEINLGAPFSPTFLSIKYLNNGSSIQLLTPNYFIEFAVIDSDGFIDVNDAIAIDHSCRVAIQDPRS